MIDAVKYMLVRIPDPFQKESKGGIVLLEQFETAEKTKQYGEVVAVNKFFEDKVDKGDTIIFHFNAVRFDLDKEGKRIKSKNHIQDDIYWIPNSMIHFVIKKDTGEKVMLNRWNLLYPVEKEEEVTESGIIINLNNDKRLNRREFMNGVVEVPNDYYNQHLKKDDKVVLKPFADYSILMPDGEERWLVENNTILAKVS